ncbi:GspH/FimT family pseudopilin [Aliiglaciecola sp. 3_MG-2023]|uniref:GspH/FimT family pseudopilin n=1 Tax=unclassified Aliiglaciecola TaxID=2593648 RepID=UPI0026E2AAFE|nr:MULTISPECIES: GspH/FimT family pseudopilin [unclassified Aliiglaciecola]MDO6691848.1 GspH/FimT family pseudopilin [Aliiglaciecola sp. 3_MG-2023]MDO6709207.1 GspH/FimT family pseudopilin [Aliiglaciecola sp. 2_MG-2023]MDO6750355.1 GspH/FimT family pseudopilin [Aliiglaciecola sp. 1_MG-2023]
MKSVNISLMSNTLQKGVTLVELMIGLAIVAIVLTISVPAAQGIIIKNRIVSEVNEISGVIQFARANAVDEQLTTIVCPTADFSTCSTNWNQVKMVFGDEDGNGSRGDDEDILAATALLSDNNYVTGPAQAIQFNPNGSANTQSTLLICHKNKEATYARQLTVTPQGRVKMSQDTDKNGVHENISGGALSCS